MMHTLRWEVFWDPEGIVVTQIATLDTLSSHILSLASTVLINHELPPREDMQKVFFNSPSKKKTAVTLSSPRKAEKGRNSFTVPSGSALVTTPRITHTQLVVASTNIGTVYVWRVHPYEFKGECATAMARSRAE